MLNPLNAELNPICHLLALLGARHILHVSRIRVKYLLLVFPQGIYNIYKWPITSLLTAYKKSDVKIGDIV
jgi:hypothetical protein